MNAQLLNALNTAVVVVNEQFQRVYLNQAAEELFQISSQQSGRTHWDALLAVNPQWHVSLQEALASQQPFTLSAVELLQPDHEKLVVDCAITPWGSGELIIELVRVDHRLRNNRDKQVLHQQDATRELLRGVAHEIKNPLGGLRGAAQLLQRALDDPEYDEYISVIIREADRLRNLVNRMLGPNNVPELAPVNIHRVLEHVCSVVEAEGHADFSIAKYYDPSIPDITADAELLIQTVLNIMQNAVQANAKRVELYTRVKRQFTIGDVRHKLVLMVDIIDNGAGIDREMQEKIFFPLVTGRAEGTGLGLSIAQNIINQHNGIIECTSEPGNTCFRILLPLEIKHD